MSMSHEQLQFMLSVLWNLLSNEFATTHRVDDNTYAFEFAAGSVPFACYCQINPEIRAFLVRGILELPIKSESRLSVGVLLHRINYLLPSGGWAIDLDTGDVRWKSGLIFPDGELSEELMFQAIGTSLAMIKEHALSLVSLWAGQSLEEAMNLVGKDPGEGYIMPIPSPGKKGEKGDITEWH